MLPGFVDAYVTATLEREPALGSGVKNMGPDVVAYYEERSAMLVNERNGR